MNDVKRIEHGGCVIRVVQDDDPMNPREWDNLGTILYVSNRYLLGDKQVPGHEINEITERDDVIWLPVYAYIHGSVALSTGSFSDPWDSGQSGIIYAEVDEIKRQLGEDFSREQVEKILRSEVETFSQYLGGDVYGYVLERNGHHVDSCWGFYGQEGIRDAIGTAKQMAEWESRTAEEIMNRNG